MLTERQSWPEILDSSHSDKREMTKIRISADLSRWQSDIAPLPIEGNFASYMGEKQEGIVVSLRLIGLGWRDNLITYSEYGPELSPSLCLLGRS